MRKLTEQEVLVEAMTVFAVLIAEQLDTKRFLEQLKAQCIALEASPLESANDIRKILERIGFEIQGFHDRPEPSGDSANDPN